MGQIYEVARFQNYNFDISTSLHSGETMISASRAVDMSDTRIGLSVENGSMLGQGDFVYLMTSGTSINLVGVNGTSLQISNVFYTYDFYLDKFYNSLRASILRMSATLQTESFLEPPTGLSQGADFISVGLFNAMDATRKPLLGCLI